MFEIDPSKIPPQIGNAKVYIVGGFVRDSLLRLTPKDCDYVVVGATPRMMEEHGFTQVGADFPVFLHPTTGDEYALARTERKMGPGYHGFDTDFNPNITIEEDLLRRDLTINSMAYDPSTATLIDPHGGQADLQRSVLRHTSAAFREDPVRILRVARFAARYNFFVHKQTRDFMLQMVRDGAMDELVPERVWAEMSRGLLEKTPELMFRTLEYCKALPAMSRIWHGGAYAQGFWMTFAPWEHVDLATRFAMVAEDAEPGDFEKNKIPSDCAQMATLLNRWKHHIPQYHTMEPVMRLALLSQVGAIGNARNTPLFGNFLETFRAWGHMRFELFHIPQLDQMIAHSRAINSITPPTALSGKEIAAWMLNARMDVVK